MYTGGGLTLQATKEESKVHLVLLSGGSGKRLWPLSNGVRAKAYLKLLPSPGGGKESMLQRVVRQLETAGLLRQARIVTHESQVELTLGQVGARLSVLGERHRRGTLAAAALAAVHLLNEGTAKAGDMMALMPVDVFAGDELFESVAKLPDVLGQAGAKLAMIGTKPHRLSAEYGYIVPDGADESADGAVFRRVARFVEKPAEPTAASLVRQGALWNSGIYAFRIGFLLERLRGLQLPVQHEDLLQALERLPELSFDREIAERTADAVVVPYAGAWHDLGSWDTLSEHLESRVVGPGTLSADSAGSQLVNELTIPVHVIGARNLIVAAGADGILVSARDRSSGVKAILAEGAEASSARIEEKRWGCRTVLDETAADGAAGTRSRTSKVLLFAGSHTSCHRHPGHTELLAVLSGEGEAVVNGVNRKLGAGDVVLLERGVPHGVRAFSEMTCIEIHIGYRQLPESIRIASDWPS